MQDLIVILIQANIHWENPAANLTMFDQRLAEIHAPVDLVVLPEMFNTGFTMNVEKCSETIGGPTLKWMQKKAESQNCVFTGSVLTKDKNKFFNRMYWVRPDGSFDYYDKRHLFRMSNEHLIMTQGNLHKIVELNGWKICLQICYDLRFPVWSRNHFYDGEYAYDTLIYVANWPHVRAYAYQKLLPARAIENQAYVLWVNRIGKDGNGINHSGNSMALDAYGKIISQANANSEVNLLVKLSKDTLIKFRNKFKVGLDWDVNNTND